MTVIIGAMANYNNDSFPTDPTPSHLGNVALQALMGIGPWQRFISVVLGLLALLMCCGGGAMVLFATLGLGKGPDGFGQGAMVGLGLVYALFAALYVVPAIFLWQSASAIAQLKRSGEAEHATASLVAQRSFWRFCGITLAVLIGLYVLLVGAAVLLGIAGAANM